MPNQTRRKIKRGDSSLIHYGAIGDIRKQLIPHFAEDFRRTKHFALDAAGRIFCLRRKGRCEPALKELRGTPRVYFTVESEIMGMCAIKDKLSSGNEILNESRRATMVVKKTI